MSKEEKDGEGRGDTLLHGNLAWIASSVVNSSYNGLENSSKQTFRELILPVTKAPGGLKTSFEIQEHKHKTS